jgi:hypothetical protein
MQTWSSGWIQLIFSVPRQKGLSAEYYPTKLDQEIVAVLDVKGEPKIIDSKQNKIEP